MGNIENVNGELRELALFAGAGGGILGGILCGFRTVCAVEIEPYAIAVLCARQNEGVLPPFPVWDDVCTFDGKAWRGIVDVISGGWPCQDISVANAKGQGLAGARSGLWNEFKRVIGEVRPRYVFLENSPNIKKKGGVRVVGDLTEMGYDCKWGIIGAHHAGAPHKRDRWWCLAVEREREKMISWPTPTANDAKNNAGSSQTKRNTKALNVAVKMFPTPTVSGNHNRKGVSKTSGDGLATVAKMFPTPTCPRSNDSDYTAGRYYPQKRPRGLSVIAKGSGAALNPDWVAWLMGWPIGWVNLEPLPNKHFEDWQRQDMWWDIDPAFTEYFGKLYPWVLEFCERRKRKLEALGNGQVPAVVKIAWDILTGDRLNV